MLAGFVVAGGRFRRANVVKIVRRGIFIGIGVDLRTGDGEKFA